MSLEKGYVRIILFMLFFAITLSVLRTYNSYSLYKERKKINYSLSATTLNNYLDDSINYIDNISKTLGQEIANLKVRSPDNIAQVLVKYKNIINNNNEILAWTLFDFVDKDGFVVATSKDGVIKTKKKVSKEKRQWITLAPQEPWKGHLSFIDYGIMSEEYIIPYGFGITDKNNNFLGIVSVGINVAKLKSKLIETLGDSQVKFLIFRKNKIDHDLELILSNINNELITKRIKNIIEYDNNFNNYKTLFEMDNNTFSYLYHKENSDFSIVIGQNTTLLNNDFKSYFYPRIEQNIILLVFLITIYVILKQKVVNPILELSKLSKNIADGHREVNIPRYDCTEIDYLAKQIKNIKKYIGIEEKKEKAEQQNISKTIFLNSISHEIRNPISAIYSIGAILENKEGYESLDDENKRYFLSEIKKQSSELLEFIQDLLDVGQAESREFKLEKLKNEDIKILIDKSIKIVRGMALKRNIQIYFESEEKLPKVKVDQKRIKQIFVNLLMNSMKYSDKNTKIFIKMGLIKKENKNLIIITIQDKGFGMVESGIKKSLTKYDSNKKVKIDSLGLKLPVIKHLIDQHGGSLRIESKVAYGTKFIITFPV